MTNRYDLNKNLAQMLKGGVIMDVQNPEQARIAEAAGAAAVMALERIPADIRAVGGVSRMSDTKMIKEIQDAVSIPVMAKVRIGHFVEAQILQAIEIDYIDESEVLTPADDLIHVDKTKFDVPFVCGAKDLGEALRRISEGASMIRTKGEPGTGETVVRTTFWLGKIALPYVSDYGYADSDLAANSYSGSTELQKYSPGGRNWIYRSGEYIPFITPVRYTPDNILRIEDPGFVSKTRVGNRLRIRPTVYLKPEVKITSGSGTSSRPYQLSL